MGLQRLAALLACTAAMALCGGQAAATTVGLHITTAHFGAPRASLESWTPGVYLRTDAGLTLGAFRNSDGDPGAYAAWTWETADSRFALTAGGMVGYRSAPITPLVSASARVPLTDTSSLRIAFLPKPKRGAAGLHLALERDF